MMSVISGHDIDFDLRTLKYTWFKHNIFVYNCLKQFTNEVLDEYLDIDIVPDTVTI